MSVQERVVVTGLGAVTSLGKNVPALWQALLNGQSGIRRITRFAAEAYPTKIASLIDDLDIGSYFPVKEIRRMSRVAQIALIAAREAVADASLDFPLLDLKKAGVLLGCSIGGLEDLEENVLAVNQSGPKVASPFLIVKMTPNMAAFAISKAFGFMGYNNTVTTGCASGTQAIGDAAQIIRYGRADMMITGGAESAISPTTLAGFCNMKAVSERNDEPEKASRPFDKNRDGFVPGEGAGVVVLESLSHALKRGAKIYCEILGYGATADAYHLIAPKPTGESAAEAMRLALADTQIQASAVDYVNAHGTSTEQGDIAETKAIKQVLGERAYDVPINSTKSMIGHLLGAAGGVEAIVTAKTIESGWIHPTINLDEPDPECDLDYVPGKARQHKVDIAISNSFGLGGQNASIVLGRYA